MASPPEWFLLRRMSPLMARSGHARRVARCPLLEAKRTFPNDGVRSAYDPKRSRSHRLPNSIEVRASGCCWPSLLMALSGLNRRAYYLSAFAQAASEEAAGLAMIRFERIGALILVCAVLLAALLILQYLMR